MKEIVIKIPDDKYERMIKLKAYYESIHEQSPLDPFIELALSTINGKVLPKGHGRLGDLDLLVGNGGCSESYARLFTIIEADKGEE